MQMRSQFIGTDCSANLLISLKMRIIESPDILDTPVDPPPNKTWQNKKQNKKKIKTTSKQTKKPTNNNNNNHNNNKFVLNLPCSN